MKNKLTILNTILILFVISWKTAYIFRGHIENLWNDWMTEDSTPEPIAFTDFLNSNAVNHNSNTTINSNENTNTESEPIELPAELNLDVPFTTQAPHANWDEVA